MSKSEQRRITLELVATFDEMPDLEELQRIVEDLRGIAGIHKADLTFPAVTTLDLNR